MALMANTVMARARPEMTMQRLARAVRGAIGFEGRRGDAQEAAQDLIKLADKLFQRRFEFWSQSTSNIRLVAILNEG
jgi:hypothetical protein